MRTTTTVGAFGVAALLLFPGCSPPEPLARDAGSNPSSTPVAQAQTATMSSPTPSPLPQTRHSPDSQPAVPTPAPEQMLLQCKSNLKSLAIAAEMYSTDWSGHYPPPEKGGLSLLTPNYLKTLPLCPSAGTMTYQYAGGPQQELNGQHYQDYYIIRCLGNHHAAAGSAGDFPAYDGQVGLIPDSSTYEALKAAATSP